MTVIAIIMATVALILATASLFLSFRGQSQRRHEQSAQADTTWGFDPVREAAVRKLAQSRHARAMESKWRDDMARQSAEETLERSRIQRAEEALERARRSH